MDVADLITPQCVVVAMRIRDKPQLLREWSDRAAKALAIDAQTILSALCSREDLGSTGVGHGIALPHARVAGLQRFFGLFGRLERPIDFDSIDERPVDLVFLLLIPEHAGDEHLAALACISRRLRDPDVAEGLRSAKTGAELYGALTIGSLKRD